MCMAILGIINVRINSSLKDIMEECRLGWGALYRFRNVNIQKCGNMSHVEHAAVSQLDGLGE